MSLYQIYKAELLKLLKKPITLLLLVCLGLPLFYGISIVTNASHVIVQGEFDAMLFASVNWNMLTMTGVPEILFALIATHLFAYEIERGQMRLLVVRVCDRKKIIIAKFLSLLTLVLLYYIIFYVFCFAVYYVFILQTPLATGEFIGSTFSVQYMLMDLIYLIQIMIICNLVILLGLYYRAFVSFMMGIGITTVFIVFQFFPTIKYFVPAYIATAISYQQISSVLAFSLCIMYLILSFIPVIVTMRKFERIDLK